MSKRLSGVREPRFRRAGAWGGFCVRGTQEPSRAREGAFGSPALPCRARTGGRTGWQGAGLRGSSWGVLWGWGAQVSAVGLAGVRLPAGSVTQPETPGWGEGVGTGQTLAPCAISSGPKRSWQPRSDPAGNPGGCGLCPGRRLAQGGHLPGKSSSFRAGNSDGQRSLGCPPSPHIRFHCTPRPCSPTGPPVLVLCFIQEEGMGALMWPSRGDSRPRGAGQAPRLSSSVPLLS